MPKKEWVIGLCLSLLFPSLSYADAKIESVNEVVAGYEVRISGSDFGSSTGSVQFRIEEQNIKAEVIRWEAEAIIVVVPFFPSVSETAKATIQVVPHSGPLAEITTRYTLLSSLIHGIIRQKKQGFNDEFILNQFDKEISRKMLVNGGFNHFENIQLKNAGFNDNIIANLGRHPQRVTIGLAAIWLNGTNDLVTSPILRIFLNPKSFFDKRSPFWDHACLGRVCLHLPMGFLDSNKYDLNVGYTSKTATTENGSERKNYLLVGASFELNRAALLNFGLAVVLGDAEGRQNQIYTGVTVDSNILRDIGILQK